MEQTHSLPGLYVHKHSHAHFKLSLTHSKITPKRARDWETFRSDKKSKLIRPSFNFTGVAAHTHTQSLKHCYLVSPAHHRKPHVAATRQRCPDQFTLGRPDWDTHTNAHTHTSFYAGERLNLLTCTNKSRTSQLHRLGVIHSAERLCFKSLFTAGYAG